MRAAAIFLVFATTMLLLAVCQDRTRSSGASVSDSAPIRVDVKLVSVFATVTDGNGAPVGNLEKDDFEVLEDGVPQKIAVFDRESALPLSIVLAVDTSLSTRKDLRLELDAARRFARSTVRPVDALSIYQFSEEVAQVLPFTSDLKTIDRALDRIHMGSATAMYDAIYLAADNLLNRQGRKVVVVITDGGDTASRVDYHQALRQAQQAEAILYSIIIVPIENSAGRNTGGEHALIQLSHDTGGKYYYASDIPSLERAFSRISDELRTQYLLGYYPVRRRTDSDFRKIEVRVEANGDGWEIRHRTGYYTSQAP